jgi:A/G-specific adenine glycosylase
MSMKTSHIPRIREALLAWYDANHRRLPWRETIDPYRIWVSEVMLQQTRVETVLRYYPAFTARFPDIRSLAEADLEEVLKLWEGLGYYARARNIHRAARRVVDQHGGIVPRDPVAFRALPGVGEYISAAVLSISFGLPSAVVDGNVRRFLSRLLAIDRPLNDPRALKRIRTTADHLLDRDRPGGFNQAMMEAGARICRPRSPDCASCPVAEFCRANRTGRTSEYPIRVKKRPLPEHRIVVGVVRKGSRLLITRRPLDGLLGGLWEFPGGKIRDGESPAAACVREIAEETGLSVEIESHLTSVRHAYSHFRIVMEVYRCRCRSGKVRLAGPVDFRWITPGEIDRYPFPAANHKFIPLLRAGSERGGPEPGSNRSGG